MGLKYQLQHLLDGLVGRAAILDLTARHNRLYSAGDVDGWISTFRHSGASYRCGARDFADLRTAFDGGNGRQLFSLDNEISVDGVSATQRCAAVLLVGSEIVATGRYEDRLVYERGDWYFASREVMWDPEPSGSPAS